MCVRLCVRSLIYTNSWLFRKQRFHLNPFLYCHLSSESGGIFEPDFLWCFIVMAQTESIRNQLAPFLFLFYFVYLLIYLFICLFIYLFICVRAYIHADFGPRVFRWSGTRKRRRRKSGESYLKKKKKNKPKTTTTTTKKNSLVLITCQRLFYCSYYFLKYLAFRNKIASKLI